MVVVVGGIVAPMVAAQVSLTSHVAVSLMAAVVLVAVTGDASGRAGMNVMLAAVSPWIYALGDGWWLPNQAFRWHSL